MCVCVGMYVDAVRLSNVVENTCAEIVLFHTKSIQSELCAERRLKFVFCKTIGESLAAAIADDDDDSLLQRNAMLCNFIYEFKALRWGWESDGKFHIHIRYHFCLYV